MHLHIVQRAVRTTGVLQECSYKILGTKNAKCNGRNRMAFQVSVSTSLTLPSASSKTGEDIGDFPRKKRRCSHFHADKIARIF